MMMEGLASRSEMRKELERERRRIMDRQRRQSMSLEEREKHLARRRRNYQLRRQRAETARLNPPPSPIQFQQTSISTIQLPLSNAVTYVSDVSPHLNVASALVGSNHGQERLMLDTRSSQSLEIPAEKLAFIPEKVRLNRIKHLARSINDPVGNEVANGGMMKGNGTSNYVSIEFCVSLCWKHDWLVSKQIHLTSGCGANQILFVYPEDNVTKKRSLTLTVLPPGSSSVDWLSHIPSPCRAASLLLPPGTGLETTYHPLHSDNLSFDDINIHSCAMQSPKCSAAYLMTTTFSGELRFRTFFFSLFQRYKIVARPTTKTTWVIGLHGPHRRLKKDGMPLVEGLQGLGFSEAKEKNAKGVVLGR
ncbi:hypothetical protein DITRI_Ditri02bG0001400 [Diplodiscus trichospermus]